MSSTRSSSAAALTALDRGRTDAPLRIGMVAPPWFSLPPAGYGGTEAVVAGLVDKLVERGHEVVLVGAGVNGTLAQEFHAVYDVPPTERLGEPLPEAVTAAYARQVLAEAGVDVVHDHTLAGPLLATGRTAPTVVTMHGPVTGECGRYHELLGGTVSMVAISDAQRRLNPRIAWCDTVHNGIDVASFPFEPDKDDYVLWIGRFSPDKAPDLAIQAARRTGRPILLAGKLNERAEREYFDAVVAPLLGDGAEYVGEADAVIKRELFASAACLAFPIQWEEPFGMVMAEAMACGTPVVAMRRGSVPEVVADGVTGYVVDTMDDFAAGVERAGEIDPHECRRHALERFDLSVMAAGYERVYRSLVDVGAPDGDGTPTLQALAA